MTPKAPIKAVISFAGELKDVWDPKYQINTDVAYIDIHAAKDHVKWTPYPNAVNGQKFLNSKGVTNYLVTLNGGCHVLGYQQAIAQKIDAYVVGFLINAFHLSGHSCPRPPPHS